MDRVQAFGKNFTYASPWQIVAPISSTHKDIALLELRANRLLAIIELHSPHLLPEPSNM